MTGKTDVAQVIIRSEIEDKTKYLLAKRSMDGYFEWIGGKTEDGESVREAAIREMKEEIQTNWSNTNYTVECLGDSYLSSKNEKFRLNPVLISLEKKAAKNLDEENLSNEHTTFSWIEPTEFSEFNTLGQYKALENLDIVKGRVALAAVERNGKYLLAKRSQENSTPGEWGLVSGGIETGEKPEEAAVRELKEETGLKADPVEVGEFFIGEGEMGYWRLEPVLMDYVSGEVDLNWELSEYKWIKAENITEEDKIERIRGLEKLGVVNNGY